MTLPKTGTGSSASHPSQEEKSSGNSGKDARDEVFKEVVDAMLLGRGGETMVMENALRHIVTRITDEGLVIEVFDLDRFPLFEEKTDTPTQMLRDLAQIISGVSKAVINGIAVGGHVRANPVVLANNSVWELSADRATRMRILLEESGIGPKRIQRVTGHADREPVARDPMASRNNRLEIVLLRE